MGTVLLRRRFKVDSTATKICFVTADVPFSCYSSLGGGNLICTPSTLNPSTPEPLNP